MADAPIQQIVDALADALRDITIANGYRTDLGTTVETERRQTMLPSALRCSVSCTNKIRAEGGQSRPKVGRDVRGMIEIEVPASMEDAAAQVYAADDDVERCLQAHSLLPGALPVEYEETVFLDRPEGVPVVAAQIFWRTGFRLREEG